MLCPCGDGFSDDVSVEVVLTGLTAVPVVLMFCVRLPDVLVVKLPSPLYEAAILCAPATRQGVVKVATPVPELTMPMPISLLPSVKVTVPVGLPLAGDTGRTVAVNVTATPRFAGFGEEVRVVVVLP